jgi:hypothetical protein
MDPDELFLEMLNELRERSSKRPPRKYDFAVIGLLLRILLIDKQLVNTVNLKKEKVLYRMPKVKASKADWSGDGVLGLFDFLCSTGRSSQFMTWLETTGKIMEAIAPGAAAKSATSAKNVEVCDLTVEKFLAVPVIIYNEKESTVGDLVDYAANVFGGAHYDPNSAKWRKQKALRRKPIVDIQSALGAPYPLQLAMLQPIGGIVLRGLQSLEADAHARFLAKAKKEVPAHRRHVRFLGTRVF